MTVMADVPLPPAHGDNPRWQKMLTEPCPHRSTLGDCTDSWCVARREDYERHGGRLPEENPAETIAEARTTRSLAGLCYDCRARPCDGWSAYCATCGPTHNRKEA